MANADDAYLPGAARRAVESLSANSEAAGVNREGYWIRVSGETLGDPQLHLGMSRRSGGTLPPEARYATLCGERPRRVE